MDERAIRWKSRRGMKELDVMLGRYIDAGWPGATAMQRAAFAALLDQQDPVLWDLLLGRTTATDAATTDVISRIRALSDL